jgi:hypothetical protein
VAERRGEDMMVDIVYKSYGDDIPMTVEVDNSQENFEIMGIEIGGVQVYELLNASTRSIYKWDHEKKASIHRKASIIQEIEELVAAELEEIRHE